MATITFTLSNTDLETVVDALSVRWGWDQNTGLTKAEFVRQQIAKYIRHETKSHREAVAHAATTVPDVTIT